MGIRRTLPPADAPVTLAVPGPAWVCMAGLMDCWEPVGGGGLFRCWARFCGSSGPEADAPGVVDWVAAIWGVWAAFCLVASAAGAE